MTEQEARNRWAQFHKAKTNGKVARRPGTPGFPLYTGIAGDPLVGEMDLSSDLVCVCLVVDGDDHEGVAVAVERTLHGSHQNLQVVLVAAQTSSVFERLRQDAAWAKDPRVHMLEAPRVNEAGEEPLPTASANALRADVAAYTCAPYIAFLGTADLPHPERITQQLRALLETGADVCFSAAQVMGAGTMTITPAGMEATEHLGEIAPCVGMYRTSALAELGGIHPNPGGLRLATIAMALLGRVVVTRIALYTRVSEDLVDVPSEEVEQVYETAFQARSISRGTAIQKMRGAILRARHARRPSPTHAAAYAVLSRVAQAVEPPSPSMIQVHALLRAIPAELAEKGDWQVGARCWQEALASAKPIHTLITRSCPATVIAAAQAIRDPNERRFVTVLESDIARASALRGFLARIGLSSVVTVRTSPLREFPDAVCGYLWYEVEPESLVDRVAPSFVYLDGPEDSRSRHGALVRLQPVLRGRGEVWITPRPAREQEADLAIWRRRMPLEQLASVGGFQRLRLIDDPDAATNIIVTILTGARPALLKKTLASLAAKDRLLVDQAKVVVFVNGGDEASMKVAATFGFVDEIVTTAELLPVVDAMNVLMQIDFGTARFVLHLEDDWECREDGWRGQAVRILDENPRIGQVYLHSIPQSHAEVNHVSGRRITWKGARARDGFAYLRAPAAFTSGPSLVRRELVENLWPAKTGMQVLERFNANGYECAALRGSFVHIGDGQSLKKTMGREGRDDG